MNFSFDISTDMAGIRMQAQKDVAECLEILSMQILVDCNYFCKQDQGTLISSSISASDLANGDLVWGAWDTIYADRQYWLASTSTDVNENASYMWCHKAFDRFGKDWDKLLQKLFDCPEQRAAIRASLKAALQELGK